MRWNSFSPFFAGLISAQFTDDHLKVMETHLLKVFQLDSVPRTTSDSRSKLSPLLERMYHFQQDSEHEEHFEIDDDVSQISNIVRHQHEHLRLYDDGKLHFIHDIHLPEVEKLNKAELLLDTTQFQPNSTFDAFLVGENGDVLISRVAGDSEIIRIDLTEATSKWLSGFPNNGVRLTINSQNKRVRRNVEDFDEHSATFLTSRRKSKKKSSRLIRNRLEPCSREKMYIDFKSIKWTEFIVAPSGFDSYLCSGTCPYPLDAHLNHTNHAIFNSVVARLDPLETDGPCCVPTELKPLTVLYIDNSQRAVLRSYEDMVVESCGCR
ncbi:Oidioi.mRNA.OKI2018_I69.PAR.g12282.t1.cds [Oikopleura dioica]|uniref:Oidioi.mRNA.OKI2018_I69.PAR.g12282.t1.cds n=1 Tax=Oikopleura dioica TaxID=34765 RepID=A0ABN7S704_OIKDI|nr:Oidioi.mRNA.OKI2018_I69.PAR.g12282.t1.cds [Oikopleura dioica]